MIHIHGLLIGRAKDSSIGADRDPADVPLNALSDWLQAPYADLGVGQVFYKTVIDNERPTIPRDCPAEYKRLMEACSSSDVEMKLSNGMFGG